MLEWALLGALFLGIMIFCARIMRRGLRTLDDDRARYLERIQEDERKIAEDRKNISAMDHIWIMQAALEDLLRLENYPEGYAVHRAGMSLEFVTPEGPWNVEIAMRERHLRSTHRVLHGKSRWVLSGFGQVESHPDPASLMASLNAHLHSQPVTAGEPEHLARRMGGIAAIMRKI